MDQNPWAVESLQSFYFLKCPECDFDTKEENSFENHATENHPLLGTIFILRKDIGVGVLVQNMAIIPYFMY